MWIEFRLKITVKSHVMPIPCKRSVHGISANQIDLTKICCASGGTFNNQTVSPSTVVLCNKNLPIDPPWRRCGASKREERECWYHELQNMSYYKPTIKNKKDALERSKDNRIKEETKQKQDLVGLFLEQRRTKTNKSEKSSGGLLRLVLSICHHRSKHNRTSHIT